MLLANSNIYTRLPKHCFHSQCFYNASQQKQDNLKLTCFWQWSRSKTRVFAMLSMLWHPKTFQSIAIYSFFSLFAGFWSALPEACQNDPKFHVNTLLSSDTQEPSKNLAPSAARAVKGHGFPLPCDPSNVCFFLFSTPRGLPKLGNFK